MELACALCDFQKHLSASYELPVRVWCVVTLTDLDDFITIPFNLSPKAVYLYIHILIILSVFTIYIVCAIITTPAKNRPLLFALETYIVCIKTQQNELN